VAHHTSSAPVEVVWLMTPYGHLKTHTGGLGVSMMVPVGQGLVAAAWVAAQ
jgi:hypothetical protein